MEIYVLDYPKGNELKIKTGYIKNLYNYEIFHSADTHDDCSGCPIICLENYKVIGILRSYPKKIKT